MSQSSIGSYTGPPGGGYPLDPSQVGGQPPVQPGPVPAPPPGVVDPGQSTISSSSSSSSGNAQNASIPNLAIPGTVSLQDLLVQFAKSDAGGQALAGIKGTLLLDVASTYNDAINKMLDGWNESIKEQAKRSEEEAIKKVTVNANQQTARGGADYEVMLKSMPEDKRAQEIEGTSANPGGRALGTSDYLGSLNAPNPEQAAAQNQDNTVGQVTANPLAFSASDSTTLPKIAGAATIGSDITTNPVGIADPATAKALASDPYQGGITQISPAMGVAVDYTAAAAMVASLIGTTVMLASSAECLKNSIVEGTPVHNLNFAKDYAENMVALVSGPGFNNYVMAMVLQKTNNSQPLGPQDQQNVVNMMKAVLLTTALVLLYRAYVGGGQEAELGSMSGGEFLSLVKGGSADGKTAGLIPDGDPNKPTFDKLAAAINQSLADNSDAVLNLLANYVESKPNVKSLLDVTSVFQRIQDLLPEEESNRVIYNKT